VPLQNSVSQTLGEDYAPKRELNSQVLLLVEKRSGQIRLILPSTWSNGSSPARKIDNSSLDSSAEIVTICAQRKSIHQSSVFRRANAFTQSTGQVS
jgi:hypothetical protein